MREMDGLGLKLCAFQAELFRESVGALDCSSKIFIRRFMNSELAVRMDSNGFFNESGGIADALDEIERQYGKSSYGSSKYGTDEMYWIGYMYRYWAYTHEKSSRQLFKYIKPEELYRLYFPYHSLDPAQAIDRILEARSDSDRDQFSRSVEIIRRVRSEA